MVRRASSGESQPAHALWAADKKTRTCSKVPGTVAARRRRVRHTHPMKQLLSASTSDNVGSSPNDMGKAIKDPGLMVMASSTGYTTETLERVDTFLKDWEKPRRVSKHASNHSSNHAAAASKQALPSSTKGNAPFVFQRRLARIDWRTLHTIDVDRVTREVDIDTLESVLDTIAFGDIQGEDTRNFTEANFVKIFRLAQLMVEYLLHVQELLASHKSELLLAGASMQQKGERLRSRYMWQRNALLQTRHDLKQARKTLKTYEVMLKMQGKSQVPPNNQQVRHCPFCEKMFESAYYLEFHISRRHPKAQDVTEEKILAVVSKAEEATAARVKAETSAAVQAEIQQLHEKYQGDLRRAEINANAQVKSLQADLKLSTSQLHDFQNRLELLQSQIRSSSPSKTGRHGLYAVDKSNEMYNGPDQERLFELESKFTGLERQVKTLGQENSRLLQELDSAYNEVSDLKAGKRYSISTLETQVKELRKENQYLKRSMSKVEEEPAALTVLLKERQESPRDRWTREPEKDQALLALARPTLERRKRETSAHIKIEEREWQSSPEHEEPERHSISPVKGELKDVSRQKKYETSPERNLKGRSLSHVEKPKASTSRMLKGKGQRSPSTVEEMRAQLDRDMAAAHEEEKRRQKAVKQLLTKELEKEKLEEKRKGKRIRKEDDDSGRQRSTTKAEYSSESEDDSGKRGLEKDNKKVHKIEEIAKVAAMDVGEEIPTIPIPEKQKWLSEHPYVPISTLPHVLAKYPHPETVFEETHEQLSHQFDEQITEELKKFGITPDASGISDTAYSSVTTALEKQRLQRMSQVHGNDRRLMEYERGAIIWHTQRAVHDRDTEIIESQFNVATDCSSAHETDANASEDSNDDEADDSKYNSSRSHQSDRSYELDDLKITKPQKDHTEQHIEHNPRGDTGDREQSSAENSESSGNQSEQSVEVPHRKKNLTKSNLFRSRKAQSRVRPGSRTPPDNRAQYASRSFSWKPKGKPGKSVKVIQDPPSRGELIIPLAKKVDGATRDEREVVDDELGLGEWESDEEAPQTRATTQRRVKIDDRETASSLKGNGDVLRDLSPPKDLLPTKSSLLYKPAEKQSILRSSCRSSPSKSSPQKVSSAQIGILDDENATTIVLNCKGRTMEENTNDSGGSEEAKIFNELTSEIDDIISL